MERGTEPLQICAQGNVQAVRCLSQRNIGELPDVARRVSFSLHAISVQGYNRQPTKYVLLCNMFVPGGGVGGGGSSF
jgi:hypothetical protein